jgi:DNA end-binding protein Ku
MKLAEQLVEGMGMKWDPAKFHDEYREDVMALIERKIKTGKVEEISEAERPKKSRGDVLDLMPLLKESVESASAKGGRKRASGSKRARKGA